MQVLYEDNHLIAVCKPAGLLTQDSGTGNPNLEDDCKAWIKKTYQKPGNVFLGTIHRLDKPVSGIVLFAKTSKALSRMNALMRQNKFVKIYYAIVEGSFNDESGTLEHYLFHDEYKSVVVSKETPQAKLCRLHYQVKKQNPRFSLLEITLETGRYHQIRCQLSASGHPIVGDAKYKSKTPYKEESIALHHYQQQFMHPTKEEVITVVADIPFDF